MNTLERFEEYLEYLENDGELIAEEYVKNYDKKENCKRDIQFDAIIRLRTVLFAAIEEKRD